MKECDILWPSYITPSIYAPALNFIYQYRSGFLWKKVQDLYVYITDFSYKENLRNDLYCVEWDVKLYYTISYL